MKLLVGAVGTLLVATVSFAATASPVADAAMQGDIQTLTSLIQKKAGRETPSRRTGRPLFNGPPIATTPRWPTC